MKCIEITDFSFTYPKAEKPALLDIRMEVEEGSFAVLCGRSGCGKSTLLRHMKSVLAPVGKKSGRIRYRGRDLDEVDQREQSAGIGYVLQNPDNQIVTDKVWHELAFGLESLGCDTPTIRLRVAEMASYFGIQDWFERSVAELSGGQKQLLNLASVMAMHPDLLILDEPASQLDPIAASDFLETVRKINRDIGTTVILTEHRLEDVLPYADRVWVMDEGRMAADGKPAEIGRMLKGMGHDMFLAMPAPVRIFAGVDGTHGCPLTVSQGRRWLQTELGRNGAGAFSGAHAASQRDGQTASDAHAAPQRDGQTVSGVYVASQRDEQMDSGVYAVPQRDGQTIFGVYAALQRDGQTVSRKNAGKRQKEIPAICLQDVWFRYEKNMPDTIKGLTMEVRRGELFALTGGNGTGKSTAMNLIARILRPYRGKIRLEGREIGTYSNEELHRGLLGVMPQDPQILFVKKTVREDLYEMIGGAGERGSSTRRMDMEKKDAVEEIAERMKLEGLASRHPYDLSAGEQQRLALAKILLLCPRILLLDEPTKGIDSYYKRELGELLRTLTRHGTTVLMISHDVEFCAQYADRTGLFFQGGVITCGESRRFFAGNSFYTTAANRMARTWFPDAVTADDVIREVRRARERNGRKEE